VRIERYPENPLITPADVKPSRPDFEVLCVFNPGVIRFKDEILLLMRVAERPIQDDPKVIKVGALAFRGGVDGVEVHSFRRDDPNVDLSDPRLVRLTHELMLTSISHLRLARSKDGRHFTIEDEPAIFPDRPSEAFGIEDARVTEIDGECYIVYKSVAAYGITQTMVVTQDFVTYKRMGVIFCPENMDVCIFPEEIRGRYAALHRPQPRMIGSPNIWLAFSPDLRHWGDHRFLLGTDAGEWCGGRIGGGAVPIRTPDGWLEIYHGATLDDHYCLAAVLLDLENPEHILSITPKPFMCPVAPYETTGFMPNVVFTCGALLDGGRISIYYGAADQVIAGADISLAALMAEMVGVQSLGYGGW
jgi:beta-1,2-mannobiose phosphorylase / 1,2-beta-oligomannan phosphorylase